MEKRIELESRGMKADQIKELILDNCRSGGSIEGLTSDFTKLEKLSMNGVCLTSLKNFPKLVSLKKLELSDNRISSGLNFLTGCKNLKSLTLSNNNIKDFESLEPLKELENLQTLDLFHCKVTSLDNYREEVFKLLPQIKFLDGLDKNEQEDQESSGEEEDDVSEDEEDEDDEEVGDEDADDGVVQLNSDDSDGPDEDDDEEDDDDDDEEEGEGEGEEDDDDDDDDEDDDFDVEDDEDVVELNQEGAENEVGLEYLQKSDLPDEDDEDEEDFNPDDEDGDEEDDIDEEEDEEKPAADEEESKETEEQRGQKRKREDGDVDGEEKAD